MLVVKGATASPFVRKVIVALEEKGIPYEQQDLVPFPKTDELLAMNPLGKIPILEDGEHHIPDSSVILAYLERKHTEVPLLPEDPVELAGALFLEEYADTRMADVIGPLLFEVFLKPNLFQQETDGARCAEILEKDLPPLLEQLEGLIEGGSPTLLPRFSVADIAVGCQLASLALCGVEIDPATHPRLWSYASAVLSRPSFKAASAV
jgi:glutathione S-transferase